MTVRQKTLKIIWRTFIIVALVVIFAIISPFTPIFANLSVLFLNAFSTITLSDDHQASSALVVLGGGLTKKNNHIILNHYSQSRADATATTYQQTHLPIITSGVESPWLQDYLKLSLSSAKPRPIIISDNASMNTCENAVFTAKLLSYHELPAHVHLITDRYHMARARRQFARMNISTTPAVAPLAVPLSWTNIDNNLIHSRRAIYEIAALTRDIFRPQPNCRSFNQITLEEISTPRRKAKIFS
ncbi:YdcF family protein [Moraxella haemolytica]|uniref:YdcF family protein n=1 Tax=Moraxella haemolytica TaxID=2904119 RepID=UPI002543D660|nr:YdcF family protein [Moraxella sp. ZY171148]WII95810.1 YdcF family protein [Moraxella sp. ZY171148]